MEQFIVSARKYRPTTFTSVVGQSHVTQTLQNAIRNKHLAQAFLFCGPRGVGKTTCARILAKTINCYNPSSEIEACDACESCLGFNSNASFNVHELDAASNNSVDDMRSLIEQVRMAPQVGTHSVYIIDEVHMLSTAAFNAFLKTLEEPPKHAIFILATTEKHKILPTILSRCQVFIFNRITVDDIADHLAYVAKQEGLTTDSDALHIIAQKAEGGLRDALSMFDQIVSFAGGKGIEYADVIENLNVLDYDYYFKLTDFIEAGNYAEALLLFDEILGKGFESLNFLVGLGEHLRNLLVCQDPRTTSMLQVSPSIRSKYQTQAVAWKDIMLIRMLDIISKCEQGYRTSKNQRLHVELCLLQLSVFKDNQQKIESGPQRNTAPAPVQEKQPVKVEPAPEKTRVMQYKGAPALKTVSIQQHIKPQVDTDIKEVKTQAPEHSIEITADKPFTLSALKMAWASYAEKQAQEGKPIIYSILSREEPSLKSPDTILFKVLNETQTKELESERTNLMSYLRKSLQNFSIQLAIEMDDTIVAIKALTTEEKLIQLEQRNPHFSKFRERLGLQPE